jgi:hypothetical protein
MSAESVDNHCDNRSRHHDDRGRERRHDSYRDHNYRCYRCYRVTELEWSMSLWPEHPRREVPFALSFPDQRAKVRRGH